MYPPMDVGGEEVVLRPMNCPHHILVFEAERRRVRELPLRIAELGSHVPARAVGGRRRVVRVRQMTLNDGHVFCLPEHLDAEIANILAMVERGVPRAGDPAPRYRLSLRAKGRSTSPATVVATERRSATRGSPNHGSEYDEAPGEAAFYGPKIDLQVRDPGTRGDAVDRPGRLLLAGAVRPGGVRRRPARARPS